jgi:DNA/RNA-binding domain of Phe-tRNA-synthetase-like protein
MNKLTREELFNWMLSNKISISYNSPMTWVDADGTKWKSNWVVSDGTTQYATLKTLEDTLQEAYRVWSKK